MDNFKDRALEFAGIRLSQKQIEQFEQLANSLLETNKTTNLTAIRDLEGVYTKHFLDSLTLLKALPEKAKNLADIGSGAGFPGLAIAIARPDIKITMVESIGKKTAFIQKSIELLKLKNAVVVKERVEALGNDKKFKKSFDVVTARAVAFLPKLIELCMPLVKAGGVFLAMKNDNEEELNESEKSLHLFGGIVERKIQVNIPTLTPRQLIIIRKK